MQQVKNFQPYYIDTFWQWDGVSASLNRQETSSGNRKAPGRGKMKVEVAAKPHEDFSWSGCQYPYAVQILKHTPRNYSKINVF